MGAITVPTVSSRTPHLPKEKVGQLQLALHGASARNHHGQRRERTALPNQNHDGLSSLRWVGAGMGVGADVKVRAGTGMAPYAHTSMSTDARAPPTCATRMSPNWNLRKRSAWPFKPTIQYAMAPARHIQDRDSARGERGTRAVGEAECATFWDGNSGRQSLACSRGLPQKPAEPYQT